MSYRRIALCLVTLVLSGCATSRPELPEEKYQQFALGRYAISACGRAGMIPASTASLGLTYNRSAILRYTYSSERFDSLLIQQSWKANQAECNDLAIMISQRSQQIQGHNATVDQQRQETQNMINSTRPRQTYCNRTGSQTLCNSF